ncbi:hypothetical protein DsansV1_C08g0078251 [Dioscorea sansibarensis]
MIALNEVWCWTYQTLGSHFDWLLEQESMLMLMQQELPNRATLNWQHLKSGVSFIEWVQLQGNSLVCCSGQGKNGAICVLQQSIHPEAITQVCRVTWLKRYMTVNHKSSHGHTTDSSKRTTEDDEWHAYLIVLETADGLGEVTERVDYYVQGSMIAAGNLFGSIHLLVGDPSICTMSVNVPPIASSNEPRSACRLYHDRGQNNGFGRRALMHGFLQELLRLLMGTMDCISFKATLDNFISGTAHLVDKHLRSPSWNLQKIKNKNLEETTGQLRSLHRVCNGCNDMGRDIRCSFWSKNDNFHKCWRVSRFPPRWIKTCLGCIL